MDAPLLRAEHTTPAHVIVNWPAEPWHYRLLGVPAGCPLSEAEAAYDGLVRRHDPRLAPPDEQPAAIRLQNLLNEAIDALTAAYSAGRVPA